MSYVQRGNDGLHAGGCRQRRRRRPPGARRFIRPASTVPEPTSTNVSKPSATRRPMLSSQRTGWSICAARLVLISVRRRFIIRRQIGDHGQGRVLNVVSASTTRHGVRRRRSSARMERARNVQGNDPLGAVRFGNFARFCDAFGRAGNHDLAAAVEVGGLDGARPALLRPAGRRRPRPRRVGPARRPSRPGVGDARRGASPARGARPDAGPVSSDSAPAATSAAYSPTEWPATASGGAPASCKARRAATEVTNRAGCV